MKKKIGVIAGVMAVIGMVMGFDPPAEATSSNSNGGMGSTVVQETGGFQGDSSTTPTSMVVSGTQVKAPHGNCPPFEASSGICQ